MSLAGLYLVYLEGLIFRILQYLATEVDEALQCQVKCHLSDLRLIMLSG